jgi:hypothetical protein
VNVRVVVLLIFLARSEPQKHNTNTTQTQTQTQHTNTTHDREPTVGWALNVYVPALITSQQAWLNPKMEEHEETCVKSLDNNSQLIGPMYGGGGGGAHKKRRLRRLAHAAVQGAGSHASNDTGLPEAVSTVRSDEWAHGVPPPPPPQQQRVRTLCLEDHGGQMIHLGEGSRDECYAHRARRRLLGDGAATDPGVLLVAARDAPPIEGQGAQGIVAPVAGQWLVALFNIILMLSFKVHSTAPQTLAAKPFPPCR